VTLQPCPRAEFTRDGVYFSRESFSPCLDVVHPGEVGPKGIAHLLALVLELIGHAIAVLIAERLLTKGAHRLGGLQVIKPLFQGVHVDFQALVARLERGHLGSQLRLLLAPGLLLCFPLSQVRQLRLNGIEVGAEGRNLLRALRQFYHLPGHGVLLRLQDSAGVGYGSRQPFAALSKGDQLGGFGTELVGFSTSSLIVSGTLLDLVPPRDQRLVFDQASLLLLYLVLDVGQLLLSVAQASLEVGQLLSLQFQRPLPRPEPITALFCLAQFAGQAVFVSPRAGKVSLVGWP
jgi:hypothetical protein